MSSASKTEIGATGLVVLAVFLVAVVMLSNTLFRGWRLDLTEDNLYTMSQGSKNVLAGIDEPINLYLFFSDRATEGFPSIRVFANRVREMLEEFAQRADGKIRLQVIDPLPFSEEEDRAAQFGLQAVNLARGGDPVYLGLAGSNSVGDEEIISFFDPAKESLQGVFLFPFQ